MAAMAVPEWSVSYVPAEVTGVEVARRKGYHFMHIRAFADAIDFDRSDCRTTIMKSAKTGDPFRFVDWMSRIRFKAGLQPPCDLFEDKTSGSDCFATDALAQRVLAAGCTGIDFLHPLWFQEADGRRVLRTAGGMVRTGCDGDMASAMPISPEEADAGPPTAAAQSLDDFRDELDTATVH